MRIYRLTLATYAETALSGEGTMRVGGRWSPMGRPAVYASESIALAVLETLVHAPPAVAPVHRVIVVDVPDSVAVTTVEAAILPDGWRGSPAPAVLQATGRAWLDARETAILKVPSAIVPPESNFPLNPLHSDFQRLVPHPPAPFEIDVSAP